MAIYIQKGLDTQVKLRILGEDSQGESTGFPSHLGREGYNQFIYPACGDGGKILNIFKILRSNICKNNCYYCAANCRRSYYRLKISPEELALTFMRYYRNRKVQGLFISSAIERNADFSQEEILKTIKILRGRFNFTGYIHCKIMPGANTALIEESARYASRLSLNLEVPNESYLDKIAPEKNFREEILNTLGDMARITQSHPLPCGITTQLVVGAAGEKDHDILKLAGNLYRKWNFKRVYYSGFYPVKDTPLENIPPCPDIRVARLYQSDILIRAYGFKEDELVYDKAGNLLAYEDPKTSWAKAHPEFFPVEVNTACFSELIRVPGIGRISAKIIIQRRQIHRLRELEQLKDLRIPRRAFNYLTLR